MKNLFDELCFEISKMTTKRYSTSFSMGIMTLGPNLRPAIYAIYGYVRLADEIVDSFHGYDKALLLGRFKEQTWQAIEEGISTNPILQSFQMTVKQYGIEKSLIEQFLHSMEMDLRPLQFDAELLKEYVLGSAEVVGLMCLHVFVEGDKKTYNELKPYAMKLGSAFQKINFLRDLKDDYHVLGRAYFPQLNMQDFDSDTKALIEQEIEAEFRDALEGIKQLPASSKSGVYLAYKYYLTLFHKIKKTPPHQIMQQRVRVPNLTKVSLMVGNFFKHKIALL
jgi:phytoene synthase